MNKPIRNGNVRFVIKFTFILTAVILLYGCSTVDKPLDNDMFLNIIVRSNDFLKFCIFLIKSEELYVRQIISRLYYSYFSLARIVHIGKTKKFNIEKHDVIWQINKKDVRQLYGSELKKARNFVDYAPYNCDEIESECSASIHNLFYSHNDSPFYTLLNDAKEQSKKFYKNEPNKDIWLKKCDTLFDSIEQNHQELKKFVIDRTVNNWNNENQNRKAT